MSVSLILGQQMELPTGNNQRKYCKPEQKRQYKGKGVKMQPT